MTAQPIESVLLALSAAALIGVMFFAARRALRRRAVRSLELRQEWRHALERDWPLWQRLPSELRARVERGALEFASRVDFVGCNGLRVTDEMRIVVAAQAALLVINRGIELYRPLYAVLLYPDDFVARIEIEDEAGVITCAEDALSGEAIATDRIVLSWRSVIEPDRDAGVLNLVLHECAHFLDNAAGGTLSARPGGDAGASPWHDVLDAEYERLCRAVEADEDSLIDPYGAEDPSEFFAVATEVFFENAAALKRRNPALYQLLKDFYALDPAAWH